MFRLLEALASYLDDGPEEFNKGKKRTKISNKKFFEKELYLFNYDFDDESMYQNWKQDEPNPFDENDVGRFDGKKVIFNYLYKKNGKKWYQDDLDELENLCLEGKSFLEIASKTERTEQAVLSKLKSLDWVFDLTNQGSVFLTKYDGIKVKKQIRYSPKSFYNSKLYFDTKIFKTIPKLEFPLPLKFVNKEELDIVFKFNGEEKKIHIEDNLMTYRLGENITNKDLYNSEIEISNSHLGNVSVNFKELDGNWSEYLLITSFFKKHNII